MIGKVVRRELRSVWPHEAHDFTKWLEDNISELNEVLDFEIEVSEREGAVGTFSVDLVGTVAGRGTVVIENQFGKSDHDHLGKLLTYASNREARIAIWIVEDARPEHITAVTRLNEMPDIDFFIIKVEAIQIENSAPAALFTPIVSPSNEIRSLGRSKAIMNETETRNQEFWSSLLKCAMSKLPLHKNTSVGRIGYVSAPSGIGGVYFNYNLLPSCTRVDLYMMRDSSSENKVVYDALLANKTEIEEAFGAELYWQRLDNKKASRVSYTINNGGRKQVDAWDDKVIPDTVEAMIRFYGALKNTLSTVKL